MCEIVNFNGEWQRVDRSASSWQADLITMWHHNNRKDYGALIDRTMSTTCHSNAAIEKWEGETENSAKLLQSWGQLLGSTAQRKPRTELRIWGTVKLMTGVNELMEKIRLRDKNCQSCLTLKCSGIGLIRQNCYKWKLRRSGWRNLRQKETLIVQSRFTKNIKQRWSFLHKKRECQHKKTIWVHCSQE